MVVTAEAFAAEGWKAPVIIQGLYDLFPMARATFYWYFSWDYWYYWYYWCFTDSRRGAPPKRRSQVTG